MRRVTSWLHGGWNPAEGNSCRMVPSKRDEVRGAQAAAMTSRKKSAAVNCRAGGAHYGKKKKKSKPRHFEWTRAPGRGWKTPLLGAQEVLVRGMG